MVALRQQVTGDLKTLSKNKRYELKQAEKGLEKITVWVPVGCKIEFKQMAEFCCDNRSTVPFMVRDINTGRMKKAE